MAACSATKSVVAALPTPIIPRPPPSETARASAPPATPAIGAPTTGAAREKVRVSGVRITPPSRPLRPSQVGPCRVPPRARERWVAGGPSAEVEEDGVLLLLGRGSALLGAGDLPQELVAAPRPDRKSVV